MITEEKQSWISRATPEAYELMKIYAHYVMDGGIPQKGNAGILYLPDMKFFHEYQFIHDTLLELEEKRLL